MSEQMETVEQAYERGQKDAFRLLSAAFTLAGKFDDAEKVLQLIPVAYSAPKAEQKEQEG